MEYALRDGKAVPTFPNARYVVQRGELEHARHPTRARPRQLLPGQFRADGPDRANGGCSTAIRKLCPAWKLIRAPGHNARHDVRAAFRRRADAPCFWPTWCRRPRTCPRPGSWASISIRCRRSRTRRSGLPKWCSKGWLAIFAHDRQSAAPHICAKEDGKVVAEPVAVD